MFTCKNIYIYIKKNIAFCPAYTIYIEMITEIFFGTFLNTSRIFDRKSIQLNHYFIKSIYRPISCPTRMLQV